MAYVIHLYSYIYSLRHITLFCVQICECPLVARQKSDLLANVFIYIERTSNEMFGTFRILTIYMRQETDILPI